MTGRKAWASRAPQAGAPPACDRSGRPRPPRAVSPPQERGTPMAEPSYIHIPVEELQSFVTRIFLATGCAQKEAARIAEHLVGANLAGHDSHGVVRVPRYV
ncbi:MAG: Ldh family oxidoreductase, partial [Roseococcus sp.]